MCGLCHLLTLWPDLNPLLCWLLSTHCHFLSGKFIERKEHWAAREQDPLEGIRCHNKMTFFFSQSLMPRTVCTLSVRNQQRRLGNTMYLCSKKKSLRFPFSKYVYFPLSSSTCLWVSAYRLFHKHESFLKEL